MSPSKDATTENRGWPAALGIFVATLVGLGGFTVGPYVGLLCGPLALIAGLRKDRRQPGSFASGLFFGSMVWFTFNLLWAAAYYSFFSTLDRP